MLMTDPVTLTDDALIARVDRSRRPIPARPPPSSSPTSSSSSVAGFTWPAASARCSATAAGCCIAPRTAPSTAMRGSAARRDASRSSSPCSPTERLHLTAVQAAVPAPEGREPPGAPRRRDSQVGAGGAARCSARWFPERGRPGFRCDGCRSRASRFRDRSGPASERGIATVHGNVGRRVTASARGAGRRNPEWTGSAGRVVFSGACAETSPSVQSRLAAPTAPPPREPVRPLSAGPLRVPLHRRRRDRGPARGRRGSS